MFTFISNTKLYVICNKYIFIYKSHISPLILYLCFYVCICINLYTYLICLYKHTHINIHIHHLLGMYLTKEPYTEYIKSSHQSIIKRHMKWCLTSLVIREMQMKFSMKEYYMSTWRAKMKKTDNTKQWQGCGATRTFIHCSKQYQMYSHSGKFFGNVC